MVKFEKGKYTVEVTDPYPASAWLDTVTDIIRAIGAANKEYATGDRDFIYGLCVLLEDMLPSEEQAMKMMPGKAAPPGGPEK